MGIEHSIFKMFKNRQLLNKVFVECGASDGIHRSNCLWLEQKLGWTGFNIEADPVNYALLEKNRPCSTNLNFALSDKSDEELEFIKLSNGWNCLKPCVFTLSINPKNVIDTIMVKSISYVDFVKRYNINKIDFLSLDVEGHEEVVVDNMIKSSVLPEYLCIEHNHLDKNALTKKLNDAKYNLIHEEQYDSIFQL